MNRQNCQSVSDTRKADEARLYALIGGLTKSTMCYGDFGSNKVFRGDLNMFYGEHRIALNIEAPPDINFGRRKEKI